MQITGKNLMFLHYCLKLSLDEQLTKIGMSQDADERDEYRAELMKIAKLRAEVNRAYKRESGKGMPWTREQRGLPARTSL